MATPRIQSVDRAFSLLKCLANAGGSESLPAMAEYCGLSVATAHRLLATLEANGAVVHTAPGKYRIGMELLRLAGSQTQDNLIAAAAEPHLLRIIKTICPTSHLGTLDEDCMVTYIAKATQRTHSPPTQIGSKLEGYCSALGKVLLAALPREAQEAYVADGPFVALTERTIVDGAAFLTELQQVSRQGYAVDDCELFEDLRCVAVPIVNRAGQVVAAISASAPVAKLPKSELRSVANQLAEHASRIGAKLYPAPAAKGIIN